MLRVLVWLSVGIFAVGTEAFMIAGLLPGMAADLGVGAAAAGQLVTVFSLVYALGSPVVATLTARYERKRVLMASLAAFLLANLIAASATGYATLMIARVLQALAAGVFSPAAYGFAGTFAAPEKRGRAMSIVLGGLSAALALGTPFGTWIGGHLGWRATFVGVAVLSALALLGIALRLPRQAPGGAVTLAQRVRTAFSPGVARALLVTVLWIMGAFSIYTYVAVLLRAAAGMDSAGISLALFVFGAGAAAGSVFGGHVMDRFGPMRLLPGALGVLAAIYAAISGIAHTFSGGTAGVLFLAALGLWGIVAWGIVLPAQQIRLMGIAPTAAPIVLSLNQSAVYLGIAGGAAFGALVLRTDSAADIGWVGSAGVLSALAVLLLGRRRALLLPQAEPAAKAS